MLDDARSHYFPGENKGDEPVSLHETIEKGFRSLWVERETFGMDADALDAIPHAPPAR